MSNMNFLIVDVMQFFSNLSSSQRLAPGQSGICAVRTKKLQLTRFLSAECLKFMVNRKKLCSNNVYLPDLSAELSS